VLALARVAAAANGRYISHIRSEAQRGTDPATTLMWLIAESRAQRQHETVVATGMAEHDVSQLLQWPHTSVSSDGALARASAGLRLVHACARSLHGARHGADDLPVRIATRTN
jgi:hypothetical protein